MAVAATPSSNGSSATNPTGATRITPPHPLLSLIGCPAVPIRPDRNADRQALPGARRVLSTGQRLSHPSRSPQSLTSSQG